MMAIREDLFRGFAFWGTILLIKVLVMVPLTARQRFAKKIFMNPEDLMDKSAKVGIDDDVERVRRAHLNDLENILPWFIMTSIWLTTGPSYTMAMFMIRSFVIARILHTLFYAIFGKQPHRAIVFFIGYGVTIFEAISTLIYYM